MKTKIHFAMSNQLIANLLNRLHDTAKVVQINQNFGEDKYINKFENAINCFLYKHYNNGIEKNGCYGKYAAYTDTVSDEDGIDETYCGIDLELDDEFLMDTLTQIIEIYNELHPLIMLAINAKAMFTNITKGIRRHIDAMKESWQDKNPRYALFIYRDDKYDAVDAIVLVKNSYDGSVRIDDEASFSYMRDDLLKLHKKMTMAKYEKMDKDSVEWLTKKELCLRCNRMSDVLSADPSNLMYQFDYFADEHLPKEEDVKDGLNIENAEPDEAFVPTVSTDNDTTPSDIINDSTVTSTEIPPDGPTTINLGGTTEDSSVDDIVAETIKSGEGTETSEKHTETVHEAEVVKEVVISEEPTTEPEPEPIPEKTNSEKLIDVCNEFKKAFTARDNMSCITLLGSIVDYCKIVAEEKDSTKLKKIYDDIYSMYEDAAEFHHAGMVDDAFTMYDQVKRCITAITREARKQMK